MKILNKNNIQKIILLTGFGFLLFPLYSCDEEAEQKLPEIATWETWVACPQPGLKSVPATLVYESLKIDNTPEAACVGVGAAELGVAVIILPSL